MNECGLLLLNLGSPDSFSIPDVRKYLGEFLMDERVIDAPYLVRSMIVKGFILPFRPRRSAHAYSKVWTEDGSPLIAITRSFKKEIEKMVDMPVAIAMRYGNPTPAKALEELSGVKKIYIAPLYPHYAMSSYETAVQHALKAIDGRFEVKVLKPFYSEESYIDSLTASIRPHITSSSHSQVTPSPRHLVSPSPRHLVTPSPHLLFSYHGLPVRHLRKSDTTGHHCYSSSDCCDIPSQAWNTCYKHQVMKTTRLVADRLRLKSHEYTISFQSRLGKDRWIKPFTAELLETFPSKGIKDLVVVCPAFVADCLETLEEIAIGGKDIFIKAGGESFKVIPCLNTFKPWVNTFASWCNQREAQHATLWA